MVRALIATGWGRGAGQGWPSKKAVPRRVGPDSDGGAFHTEETGHSSLVRLGPQGPPCCPSWLVSQAPLDHEVVPEGSILIPSELVTLDALF